MKKKKTPQSNYTKRLRSLIDIGVALSSEKELNNLLRVILKKAIDVTQCEGASIYLVHEKATHKTSNVVSLQKESVLRFLKSMNRREGVFDQQGVLPIDSNSIAGHVAQSKEILNIKDCYKIDSSEVFQFNDIFDQNNDYKSKSMLTIPMITADGKVKGVLQLINKLSDKGLEKLEKTEKIALNCIRTFSADDVELMRVFASYAAIALENSQLTENIENLFESFVRASVKAIESRDPTTSGHSDRVAMMTVELALATHKIKEGPFKHVQFSEDQIKEIRYASLLHDFGKIGVTEKVLLKKKKLHDRDLESILLRFDTTGFHQETKIWRNLSEKMLEQARGKSDGSFDPDKAFKKAFIPLHLVFW